MRQLCVSASLSASPYHPPSLSLSLFRREQSIRSAREREKEKCVRTRHGRTALCRSRSTDNLSHRFGDLSDRRGDARANESRSHVKYQFCSSISDLVFYPLPSLSLSLFLPHSSFFFFFFVGAEFALYSDRNERRSLLPFVHTSHDIGPDTQHV